jgi:hypothetical protein
LKRRAYLLDCDDEVRFAVKHGLEAYRDAPCHGVLVTKEEPMLDTTPITDTIRHLISAAASSWPSSYTGIPDPRRPVEATEVPWQPLLAD